MSRSEFEKWERRYRDELGAASPPPGALSPDRPPSAFLVACADRLPQSGRALDLGGGTGRHALWLAARGLTTTLADISPTALGAARAEAERRGLNLETVAADLDANPLPAGPWDLVVMTFFLWKPIFPALPLLLGPQGIFVMEHPTRRNLERHTRPGGTYVFEEGELRRHVDAVPELEVLHYEEGWNPHDRHTARILARRR